MSLVTAVTPQRKEGRFNVFLDGKYAFSLDEKGLLEAGLRRGDELDANQVASLKEVSQTSKLFDKLLRFAMIRPRSQKELEDYLKYRRKIEDGVQREDLLGRLERLGFIGDENFARWWVQERASQKRGKSLIQLELRQKGITPEVISSVLTEFYPSERELAQDLVRQKQRSLSTVPKEKRYTRLLSLLIRRGFSFDVAREVTAETLKDLKGWDNARCLENCHENPMMVRFYTKGWFDIWNPPCYKVIVLEREKKSPVSCLKSRCGVFVFPKGNKHEQTSRKDPPHQRGE